MTSGKIGKLKELCGSERVIGIFCYQCDKEKQTFSCHIACENKSNAVCSDFEELKLEKLDYACFAVDCIASEERYAAYEALCNEIWGQWLPGSDYTSLIELETCGCVKGYASLERYTPEDPMGGSFHLEILLPIGKK